MMESQILKLIKGMIPNTLPTYEVSPFEQGILAGQQIMVNKVIEFLKSKELEGKDK